MMAGKKVFVTVGTTKFEKLIEKVSEGEILDILQALGYTRVDFQVGTGCHQSKQHKTVELLYEKYFENFDEVVSGADLVISHAGAGSCLEVLKKNKPLIVVINEDLMDNHQTELAEELAGLGYLKWCTPSSLKDVLIENQFTQYKPYPEADPAVFSNYLDKCMGFKQHNV